MKPTIEQNNIIDLIGKGKNVVVVARAGTGKTTLLKLTAKSFPEKNLLAIYFNKANVEELNSSTTKPDNLYGTTIHGIAYKAIIKGKFIGKLSPFLDFKDIDKKNLDYLCEVLKVSEKGIPFIQVDIINIIVSTIKSWCNSDSYDIVEFSSDFIDTLEIGNYNEYKHILLDSVVKHWNLLISGNVKITHDVYLKMFHLGKYQITNIWDKSKKQFINIDVICLDEAQDSNPVTLGILANQQLQKLVVGDPAQSIYGWRGAVGTMDSFKSWEQASLTMSFRFTQHIAELANVVLTNRGEGNLLTGLGLPDTSYGDVTLCRKNSTIWAIAYSRAMRGECTYVESDLEGMTNDLFHISAVLANKVPRFPSKNLSMYMTKEDLIKASKVHDEIKVLINLVSTMCSFSGGLAGSLAILKDHLVSEKTPNVLNVSTIHKSKGLEWNTVTISDDFLSFKEGESTDLLEGRLCDAEVTSLLYVAVTRAKESVRFPSYLSNYFGGV